MIEASTTDKLNVILKSAMEKEYLCVNKEIFTLGTGKRTYSLKESIFLETDKHSREQYIGENRVLAPITTTTVTYTLESGEMT